MSSFGKHVYYKALSKGNKKGIFKFKKGRVGEYIENSYIAKVQSQLQRTGDGRL